jgi:hypothetical protein
VLLESIPEARSVPVLGREKAEIVPAFAECAEYNQIAINNDLFKRDRTDMAINTWWSRAV